nr:hypothetical protein [Tanacetum cinerariifolium]
MNHHLKRIFLPSFVFLDTMPLSGRSLMLTSTNYISRGDLLLLFSGYDSLRLSQAQSLWGLYHKRNVDYAYLMEDFIFSTIKLVSRHQNTQLFGALLPIELTNDEIRNSKAYKEYYVIATGEAAPKPKASVRRTKSSSDTSITPPTATASPRS